MTSAAAASRSARKRPNAAMPVITCVPLMSASPSFAPSSIGFKPARSNAAAPGNRSPR